MKKGKSLTSFALAVLLAVLAGCETDLASLLDPSTYKSNLDEVVTGDEHPQIMCCIPSRGDANQNGVTDVGDLGILADHYGETGVGWNQGDFNFDGVVDIGDLAILAQAWGTTSVEVGE